MVVAEFLTHSSSNSWKCPEQIIKRTARSTRIIVVALTFVTSYLLLDPLDIIHTSASSSSSSSSSSFNNNSSSSIIIEHDNNNHNHNNPTDNKPKKIRIFYNLFTKGPSDEERVRKIVEEQFAHIDPTYHDTNVSVTSIGYELTSLPSNSFVEAHYEEGGEDLTLHALWKYCRANSNTNRIIHNNSYNYNYQQKERNHDDNDENDENDVKVIYLHSKGSYHPNEANNKLRDFVTRGALSAECATSNSLPETQSNTPRQSNQQPQQQQSSITTKTTTTIKDSNKYECNVCSSRMSPLPHPHTSGNMWLASCNYISQLIDPSSFRGGKSKLPNKQITNRDDPCKGRGRYLGEHWVHSHPSVKPCDLYGGKEFTWAHLRVPSVTSAWAKRLAKAPRFKFEEYVLPGMCMEDHPETLRIEDFIGLRKENYELLYNASELEEDWWGWDFLRGSII